MNTPVLAVETSNNLLNDNVTLDSLTQQYNLKDIDVSKIPKNVQPLVFNSAEELSAYLTKEENASKQRKIDAQNMIKLHEENNDVTSNNNSMMTRGLSSGTQTQKVSNFVFGGAYIKVNYEYYFDNFNRRNLFSDCTYVHGFLQGVTIGNNYYEARTSSSVQDGGRSLYASSEGTMEHYLILEGIGKVWETYEVYSTYFYL